MRYFLYLCYNGTNYCGWQTQPNGTSVQTVVEAALATILRTETPIVGAGRTDAGVHARQMIAHFDTVVSIADPDTFVERLNRLLPRDISIQRLRPVQADAHARFDALSRMYRYYITTVKDPFLQEFSYRVPYSLDFDAMNRAAATLFEYEDFTSFSKLHTDVKTNNCRIMQAEWIRTDETSAYLQIKADRFLRNMVRAIVGTLLEVGRGKMTIEQFRQVVEAHDRGKAGTSVPGKALFLVEVDYPESLFRLATPGQAEPSPDHP